MGRASVRAAAIAVIALACAAGVARADDLDDLTEAAPPPLPDTALYERIAGNMTELSTDVGLRLNTLTLDLVDMRLDFRTRRARLRVGGGDSERFALRLDGDIRLQGGAARVRARVDLAVAGRQVSFALPEVDMVPRTYEGQRYMELRVPLLEGRF